MVRKRRKRRVTRIRVLLAIVLVLAIAAAVLLGLFRVHSLEILGCERHTAEEIKEDLMDDFWSENTLYFAWKYRHAVADIKAPYLGSIQAKILSPGKIRLVVKEKGLSGYVQYAGQNVYFDSDGIVLEMTEENYPGIPLVSGAAMEQPVLYQKLPVQNTAQLRTMLSITQLLLQAQLIPDNISFDENLNITLTFGNITAKLGQDEYLEEKVANLVTIYQEIAGKSGTLNMESFTGKSEPITFKNAEEPDDEGQTDEYGDSEEGSAEGSGGTEEDGDSADPSGDGNSGGGEDGQDSGSGDAPEETTGVSAFMAFDSSGTLRYDAHVVNGQVVDANGIPIDGCSVDENGNVVDAYMNVIDPMTGQLAQ